MPSFVSLCYIIILESITHNSCVIAIEVNVLMIVWGLSEKKHGKASCKI
jgi:hypothetical protein